MTGRFEELEQECEQQQDNEEDRGSNNDEEKVFCDDILNRLSINIELKNLVKEGRRFT